MKKTIIATLILLGLTGCSVFSNEPEYNLDVKNSPCACLYDGIQLNNSPSLELQEQIASEMLLGRA